MSGSRCTPFAGLCWPSRRAPSGSRWSRSRFRRGAPTRSTSGAWSRRSRQIRCATSKPWRSATCFSRTSARTARTAWPPPGNARAFRSGTGIPRASLASSSPPGLKRYRVRRSDQARSLVRGTTLRRAAARRSPGGGRPLRRERGVPHVRLRRADPVRAADDSRSVKPSSARDSSSPTSRPLPRRRRVTRAGQKNACARGTRACQPGTVDRSLRIPASADRGR